MHLVEDLIQKKRDGHPLSQAEIGSFIEGVSSGAITDAQIAAFTMATWFRGMSRGEQMALTLAMRDSGTVLDWQGLDGPVLDKHSTGGVGDMVSLILGPIVASCGAYVPMISGRGLGHTGGTLDKLESIPGFNARPGTERFQQLVRSQHIAIIGQDRDLASADRRIYAVRDVTATVSSTPLIISSILSKKLAEGLDALVMDIKYGSGAFTTELADALVLAREICAVACEAGLPCNALITDMDQPLAWSAGNALEILEAIRFLRGEARHERLLSVVLALSSELLKLGGLAGNTIEAEKQVMRSLDSGRAAEQFSKMVTAQGGPSGLMRDPSSFMPRALFIRPVFPGTSGYITAIQTKTVGTTVVALGGGRQRSEDSINPSVGVTDISGVGTWVDSGTPLAVLHAASEDSWESAAMLLKSGFSIGQSPGEAIPVIHSTVKGGAGDETH
ncbi:thymidine phosphorylase [Pseudomonadota bacterium]